MRIALYEIIGKRLYYWDQNLQRGIMADAKTASKTKDQPKVKRPSALKRDLQNERRRLRNKSFRSSVNSAVRVLERALEEKEGKEQVQAKLQAVHSIVDQGVKKGVFKDKKGARTKSRLTLRCTKA